MYAHMPIYKTQVKCLILAVFFDRGEEFKQEPIGI